MHCGRPLGQMKSQGKLKIEYEESTREYCYECYRKGYAKFSYITQGKGLYLYKGVIKQSMYRFKYANKREYARYYARQAVKMYGNWLLGMQVIVPVPVYHKKQKLRGYNQAEVLAEEISKLTGIPVDKNLIIRIKDTVPQKELGYQQRKNNLENAFQTKESIVQYTHVLVVDDIYTTGCTAEAVAKELRKQGGHQVYVLCVCIGGNE